MKKFLLLLVISTFLISCDDHKTDITNTETSKTDTLAIYFINDQHGQLDNFAKIKHIVDLERSTNDHVLLVCAGDMFSGNPIVDQFEKKGFPMIDIMNRTGFDISVLGNHEFDYGPEILTERINQAEFEWVCANVDMLSSGVPQPNPYKTLEVGDYRLTFLGLIETFGKPDDIIPSTHPWRVSDMKFARHTNVLENYRNLKSEENSDLLIALTHLGTSQDLELAENFPPLNGVIGGHSHQQISQEIAGIPVVQAASYLQLLGRLEFVLTDSKVSSYEVSFIDLETYENYDEELKSIIDGYNNAPQFEEIVGTATNYLDRTELGCFYTTALKEYYGVDASFQNGGGIRADINQGDITTLEIFNMDPFNNGSVVFTLSAKEISDFFMETNAALHVTGIQFQSNGQKLVILDEDGNPYEDGDLITIGINDYIPAVYDNYFPLSKAELQELTTAESIIQYLKTINSTVDQDGCNRYFRYD